MKYYLIKRVQTISLVSLFLIILNIDADEDNASGENSDGGCLDVVAYGFNPELKMWEAFSTPCDVPKGWEISYNEPKPCEMEKALYAQSPQTGQWYFMAACDIPENWVTTENLLGSECLQVKFAYAKNPETQTWYKFASTCDVPSGWEIAETIPTTLLESQCKNYHAYFLAQENRLHLPIFYYEDDQGQRYKYKGLNLILMTDFYYPLFVLPNTKWEKDFSGEQ